MRCPSRNRIVATWITTTTTKRRPNGSPKTVPGCANNFCQAGIRRYAHLLPRNTFNDCGLLQEGIFELNGCTITPRRQAIADVHDITCYYREHAGILVSENFAIEIDEAYARLSQHPNIGSLRPAYDLEIEGVRSWALNRFPHRIFYDVRDDHVELWRILPPRRDLTQSMLSTEQLQ